MMQGVLNRFRMFSDDSEKDASGSVGTRSALFPVSHRGRRKTKARGELSLTQLEPAAHLADVHVRDGNGCDADRNLFASCPPDRLIETCEDLLASAAFSAQLCVTCILSSHCILLLV